MTNFRSYQTSVQFFRETEKLRLKGELKDQLHRASLSIVLNLAEGYGKFKGKDQIRFFKMAYASTKECQALLEVIEADTLLRQQIDQLGAMLYRLVKSG